MKLFQVYFIHSDGSYERMSSKKIISEVSYAEGQRLQIDTCNKFLPYIFHLWLEKYFLFPQGERLHKTLERGSWYSFKWRILDFLYGILNGFPICCIFFYVKRENFAKIVSWEENYIKCRRCIRNERKKRSL